MLLRNLDPSNDLCNGTRMVCRDFGKHVIFTEIAMGQHIGKHVFIPHIPLSLTNDEGYLFKFKRKQFLVRFSFVMIITRHKDKQYHMLKITFHKMFSHTDNYMFHFPEASLRK